jgi:hypothetical protein
MRNLLLILVAAAGVAYTVYNLRHETPQDLRGIDFPVFYAGGELVGSPALYDPAAVRRIVQRETGYASDFTVTTRLPYYYALMKPWTALPLWRSFTLWRVAFALSAGVFVLLWPAPKTWTAVLCAWSLPLAYGITNGQDIAFLLVVLAAGLLLLERDRDFAAGLVLSLTAAKFHFFFLLPILLLARRRALGGWAAGSLALIAACFAVQGPHWPAQWIASISHNIDPKPTDCANLRGLVDSNLPLEIAIGAVALAAALFLLRRADLPIGLATVLLAGVLLSHHLTKSDTALWIPAALLLATHPRARYSRLSALALASPLSLLMPPWEQVLISILTLGLLCYETVLTPRKPALSPA